MKLKKINFKENKTGSVLVFALVILAMMLVTALGIASVTVIEKRTSLGTARSTQAFQLADSGVEVVMGQLQTAIMTASGDGVKGTISGAMAGFVCNSANQVWTKTLSATPLKKYEIIFYDRAAETPTSLACDKLIEDISRIKSIGTYRDTIRSVEAPVSSCFLNEKDQDTTSLWHLNSSLLINDSAGDNDGTVRGSLIINDDGICSKTLAFDGKEDNYVSVPLNEASNEEGTFEEWVRPKGWSGGDGVCRGTFQTEPIGEWENNEGQIALINNYTDDLFYFRIVVDGGCGNLKAYPNCDSGDVKFDASDIFKDGEWTYVAATWSKTDGKIIVYINGKEKESLDPWPAAGFSFTKAVNTEGVLGVAHNGSGLWDSNCAWEGDIDEVRISKVAKTPEEILETYNRLSPKK